MMPPILKKKRFWIVLTSFLIIAWVGQSTYRAFSIRQEEDAYRLLYEGDTVPINMPLMFMEGARFTNFEEFAGKVVLVNFWAAWCGPCLKEMPSIYRLHEMFNDRGFSVLAVSMDDDMDQGLATLTRIAGKPPFPILKGIEQAIANRFPIEGLPFTVIVDRKGVIRYAKPGERDWIDKEAVALIEGLM